MNNRKIDLNEIARGAVVDFFDVYRDEMSVSEATEAKKYLSEYLQEHRDEPYCVLLCGFAMCGLNYFDVNKLINVDVCYTENDIEDE